MSVAEGGIARFEFGRVMGQIFSLIGRNFFAFFFLSVLLAGLPYAGVSYIQRLALFGELGGFQGLAGLLPLLGGLINLVCTYVLQAALTRGSVDDLAGKGLSLGDALGAGLRFILPLLGLAIVVGIAVGFGFLLLIVPGILLALRWIVAAPIVVIEDVGISAAMGRSAELTKNHRWAIFGIGLIFWVVFVALTMVAALLSVGGLDAMASEMGETSYLYIGVMSVLQAVTSLFATVGVAAIYFELRRVKDGVGAPELAAVFD